MIPENRETWPEIMVDIETLGTSSDAVILEIGVCAFRMDGTMETGLGWKIRPETEGRLGRKIDATTLQWWMSQWREASEVPDLFSNETWSLDEALVEFASYICCHEAWNVRFWSRGNLDPLVLEHAFNQCGISVPWKFYQWRDCRTLCDVTKVEKIGITEHSAVEDARRQIREVVEAMRRIDRQQDELEQMGMDENLLH